METERETGGEEPDNHDGREHEGDKEFWGDVKEDFFTC